MLSSLHCQHEKTQRATVYFPMEKTVTKTFNMGRMAPLRPIKPWLGHLDEYEAICGCHLSPWAVSVVKMDRGHLLVTG